ncbi:MAG: thiolase domain-containing protein [Nitrososphaeria archaeon]|nr:thiolase domain-containing protein [Conexivisphaerales archaeon]
MRRVGIIGASYTKFGERFDVNMQELAWEAFSDAIKEANIEKDAIDYFVLSNMGGWSSESLPAVIVSEGLGINPKGSVRVEAACASGSSAVKLAHDIVASGQANVVLALGIEKMRESPTKTVVEYIGRAGNFMWEFENFGLTFPGYYALYATAYMSKYSVKEEDLCEVAVKNHYYGSFNEKAQFRNKITVEKCMSSPYVAWPLKLYDCSPITDGAAAVLIASEDFIKEHKSETAWISGIGYATGTANLSKRDDFTGLEAAKRAALQAYARAGLDPEKPASQLDLAEVHDCFTIAEVMAYEDLGFAKKGEGIKLVKEKQTYKGGLIPVNLDGGLKAKGHPIGATGESMIAELYHQLLGKVKGERQTDIKKGRALAHNVGGTGHYAYVTVLSLEKGGVA